MQLKEKEYSMSRIGFSLDENQLEQYRNYLNEAGIFYIGSSESNEKDKKNEEIHVIHSRQPEKR